MSTTASSVNEWWWIASDGQFNILTNQKSLCTLGEEHLGSNLQRKAMANWVAFSLASSTDAGQRRRRQFLCRVWAICSP